MRPSIIFRRRNREETKNAAVIIYKHNSQLHALPYAHAVILYATLKHFPPLYIR